MQSLLTQESFVSGDASPLRVRYFRRLSDEAIIAKATFGPRTQGPPGFAHGGCIAALLDETMGGAAFHSGRVVVAASLHVNYRQMLPIPLDSIAEAVIDRVEGRKVWTRARLHDISGDVLFADAEGLFLEVGTLAPLLRTS